MSMTLVRWGMQPFARYAVGVRRAVLHALWLVLSAPSFLMAESQEEGWDIRSAFSSTELRIQVEPGKKSFTAEWEYTNPHDLPLVVQGVDSSCGCLAAKATDYKQVAKGESGKITADFSPGNHRGTLRKSIHVRFVGYAKPVELVMEAKIPSPVELSTQELAWTSENLDEKQVVEVTSGTAQDFQITGLRGVSESLFTIRKEIVSANRHYRLHVTPTGKPSPGIQTLQVTTNSPDPRDRVTAVFLRTPQS